VHCCENPINPGPQGIHRSPVEERKVLGNRKRVTQADSQPTSVMPPLRMFQSAISSKSETFFLPVAWPQKFLSGALK
jgi:hypothetical protein